MEPTFGLTDQNKKVELTFKFYIFEWRVNETTNITFSSRIAVGWTYSICNFLNSKEVLEIIGLGGFEERGWGGVAWGGGGGHAVCIIRMLITSTFNQINCSTCFLIHTLRNSTMYMTQRYASMLDTNFISMQCEQSWIKSMTHISIDMSSS